MLSKLSVQNYALIKNLEVEFERDFSVITGETGAGKSILLGALGLVLGNRADLSSLKDKEKKCIIEAEFEISNYNLLGVFESLDLDYEEITVIRRELLPSGKSRAFVNDTPVNLKSLQYLQTLLLDIHSQNHTLSLSEVKYQYDIIDTLAKQQENVKSYQKSLKEYKLAARQLKKLEEHQKNAKEQYDYRLHLYQELQEADLKEIDEVEKLESQIHKLSSAEDIKNNLYQSLQLCVEEPSGIQTQMSQFYHLLSKLIPFDDQFKALYDRVHSVKIELEDVVQELEHQTEDIVADPDVLQTLNDRLSMLFHLQKKHGVLSLQELIEKRDSLALQVAEVDDADHMRQEAEQEVKLTRKRTLALAKALSDQRIKVALIFKKEVEDILAHLGMEHTQIKIEVKALDTFNEFGINELQFLLATNKGSDFGLLKKVASGGELSRIMLAIKMIVSKRKTLPTILFDEIDTGVSGDIAQKMAEVMKLMGKNMQVITITHLPQVASKGKQHYKVFKTIEGEETISYLQPLNPTERIEELAKMLGGKDISASALKHAEQLLSNS